MAIKFKVKGSDKEVIFPEFELHQSDEGTQFIFCLQHDYPLFSSFDEDNISIFFEDTTMFTETKNHIFAFNLQPYINFFIYETFSVAFAILNKNGTIIDRKYKIHNII